MAEKGSSNVSYALPDITDRYVLRQAADSSTRTPKVYTATGVIMKKDGTDKEKKYAGNNYKYSIWAYHKLPYAQQALQQSDNDSFKDTENIQNSLLYTSYTDTSYEVGEVVIVNKKGNHVEIVGTTGELRDLTNLPVLTADLCEIELTVVKKIIHRDGQGIIIPTPPPQPQDISSIQAPNSTEIPTEEINELVIESSINCSDNYLTSVRDSIKHQKVLEKSIDPPIKVYKGFDNGIKYPKPVLARELKSTKTLEKIEAWGSDIIIPVQMENKLKALAAAFHRLHGETLKVVSVFRTQEKQESLYSKKTIDEQSLTPTAAPGTSKHQSGLAIDFQIGFAAEGYAGNKKFTYDDWKKKPEKKWPKVFKFLLRNAPYHGFHWPKWAQTEGQFESWHWVFTP